MTSSIRPSVLVLSQTLPDPTADHKAQRLGLMLEILSETYTPLLAVMASGRMHLRAWKHANRICQTITIEPPQAVRRVDLPISRTVSRWLQQYNPATVITTTSAAWPALCWFRERLIIADLAEDLQHAIDPNTSQVRNRRSSKNAYNLACKAAERSHLALVGHKSQTHPLLTRAGRTAIMPDRQLARLPEVIEALHHPVTDEHQQSEHTPLSTVRAA